MSEETFSANLKRAREGDRAALARALRCVESRLRRAARQRLSNPMRSQVQTSDLLQTTYLDVVKSIDTFRGDDEDTFAAWLTVIMENNLRDKARSFNRDKRKGPGPATPADPDMIPGSEPTPSLEAMRIENLEAVGQALDRLEESQRQVIVLRTIEGLSFSEIGERINRSEGASRMLYFRARAALAIEVSGLFREEDVPE